MRKSATRETLKHILHLFEGYVYTYKYINIYNKIVEADPTPDRDSVRVHYETCGVSFSFPVVYNVFFIKRPGKCNKSCHVCCTASIECNLMYIANYQKWKTVRNASARRRLPILTGWSKKTCCLRKMGRGTVSGKVDSKFVELTHLFYCSEIIQEKSAVFLLQITFLDSR